MLGICAGPDGNLWLTEFAGQRIGRSTIAGVVTGFALPAGTSPVGICAGPNGTLWFTEAAASKIGVMNTAGAILAEYALAPGSQPNQIALGPDGSMWFTTLGTHRLARITLGGEVLEFATPTARSGPDGIAVLGGQLFATENFASALISAPRAPRLLSFSTGKVRTPETGAVKLTLVRRGSSGTATGAVSTTEGTATAGADFTAVTKNVSVATSASLSVPIKKTPPPRATRPSPSRSRPPARRSSPSRRRSK